MWPTLHILVQFHRPRRWRPVIGLPEDGDGRDGGGDGLLEEGVALEEEVRVAPVHLRPRRPLQRHVVDQLGVVDRTLQLAAEHDLMKTE